MLTFPQTLHGLDQPSGPLAGAFGYCFLIRFLTVMAPAILLLEVVACNGSDTSAVSHGGPVRDHVSLVDNLRAQGLAVEPAGPISQPFFEQAGQVLHVNGQDLQVFEFKDRQTAQAVQRKIAPDGMSVGNTAMHWVAPPHFFSSGTILVLYLGTDATILQCLRSSLGKQVAGTGP